LYGFDELTFATYLCQEIKYVIGFLNLRWMLIWAKIKQIGKELLLKQSTLKMFIVGI